MNFKYLRTLEVLLTNFLKVVYYRSVFNLLFRDQNNPIKLYLLLSVGNDNGFPPNIWALELYGVIIDTILYLPLWLSKQILYSYA